MDIAVRDKFLKLWSEYFPGAELPLGFYYANEKPASVRSEPPAKGHHCLIGQLARVRKGEILYLDVNSIGCGGGRRYLGFETEVMPNFEYFLSYGIPGKLEGER